MTVETQAPAAAPVRVVPALAPKLFTLDTAGQVVSVWVAAPPAGVTLEDVLKPEYWAHVARVLRPLAKICIFPEDGSWEAELRVRDAGDRWANVSLIRHQPWGAKSDIAADGRFRIEWAGPHHKYRILRLADQTVMESGFTTKEAAYARLPELLKKAA